MCSWGTCIFTLIAGTVIVYAKADTGVHEWADKEARKQLKEEGII